MRARVLLAAVALAAAPLAVTATAPPAFAAPGATCDGRAATLAGTDGDDTLTGTEGDDVIAALAGDDVIEGLGGDDLICGGPGSDHLLGGSGDDRLLGGADTVVDICDDGCLRFLGDTLEGGPGADFMDPGFDFDGDSDGPADTISYAHSATGVRLDLPRGRATGEGHDTFPPSVGRHMIEVIGSGHADDLTTTPGDDRVDAGAGPDVVHTARGGDTVREHVGSGDDRYDTGSGDDLIVLTDGHDHVSAGADGDSVAVLRHRSGSGAVVWTGGGPDSVESRALGRAYAFHGGSGHDTLYLTLHGPATTHLRLDQRGIVRSGASTPVTGFDDGWVVDGADGPIDVVGSDHHDVVGVVRAPALTADLRGGDDSIGVGDSTDFDGGVRRVHVRTGSGDDILIAPAHGPLTAWLGAGDDLLQAEDDGPPYRHKVVHAGSGRDRVTGGGFGYTCTGFERGRCHGAFVPPRCDGKPATIVGTLTGHQTLLGTDGPDVIVANGAGDTVEGRGGDDTICGGEGGVLFGGDGDDTVIAGAGGWVAGGPGADDLSVGRFGGGLDYSGAPGSVTLDIPAGTATGDGTDTVLLHGGVLIAGSAFGDHITGGDEHDDVRLGAGDDVVDTGAGPDYVQSGGGQDTVNLGAGDDEARLSSTRVTVDGGPGTHDLLHVSVGVEPRGPATVSNVESTDLSTLVDGDSVTGGTVSWNVAATGPTTLDLGTGVLTTDTRTAHVADVVWVNLNGLRDATVTGSAGPDDVGLSHQMPTDVLTAHLLGGADHVGADFSAGTIDLGDGDDLLTGFYRDMTLDGGAGTDTLALALGSGNTCTGFEQGLCNP